jgi:hypothetical protein
MSLLKLAVRNQRWDLAAHTIVLATIKELGRGEPNGRKSVKKKCAKTPTTRY